LRLLPISPLGSGAMRLDEILQMLLAGDHGGRIALGFRVKSVFIEISISRARLMVTKAIHGCSYSKLGSGAA
jgi:hypothetical protein